MALFGFLKREADGQHIEKKADTKANATVRSNTVCIGEANALTVAAFYHAIDLRAKTFSRVQIEYQALDAKTDCWRKMTWGNKQKLNYLLHVKPNSRQNAQQMWEMALRMRDLSHNGMCCIYAPGMSRGNIEALIPCTGSWNYYDNTYAVTNQQFAIAGLVVDAADVIVMRSADGCSLVSLAKRTLSLSATAEEFTLDTFGKGGTFKAIVKQESTINALDGLDGLDDEEVEKNTEEISRQFREGNDFIYDPSAAAITPISQSFQDLQVDLNRTKATEDIARVCNVPLPLMYCSTNAVYKSIDDAWHTFKELAMQPLWNEVVMELNSKYLNYMDYGKHRFFANTKALCLDSEKNKADTKSVLVNAGILTRNEARHMLNLAPINGGDELNKPKYNETIGED